MMIRGAEIDSIPIQSTRPSASQYNKEGVLVNHNLLAGTVTHWSYYGKLLPHRTLFSALHCAIWLNH